MSEAPAGEAEPLLRVSGARLTVDDVVAVEAFDLVTEGAHVVLVGDGSPFLAALGGYPLGLAHDAALARVGEPSAESGVVRVASGTVRLSGLDVASRAHVGRVGAAPFEPPLPDDTTLVAWLLDVARLAMGRATRRERALRVAELIDKTQLGALAKAKIGVLPRPARRALVLAQAALGAPAVLVAELPLADLDAHEAAVVLGAWEALTQGSATIVSVARAGAETPEHGLVRRATHVAGFRHGQLVFSGPPQALGATGRLYRLTVRDNADALRTSLAAQGLELAGGPLRFSLTLPEGQGPSDVLAIASDVRASVVEIVPVM